MVSKRGFHYCRVILATSAVWCLLDVILIMYLYGGDCPVQTTCLSAGKNDGSDGSKAKSGLLARLLNSVAWTPKASFGLGSSTDTITPHNQKAFRKSDKSLRMARRLALPVPLVRSQPDGPGEGGRGVNVPKDKEEESKKKFAINQFNLVASDMISLNRSLPDYRMPACRSKQYPPVSDLPDTSIVIVFHNEAWSTLLRTVWSIINRSPRQLLREIILVDDASERDYLGSPLEEYLLTLPLKVRVIRMGKRSGLIRARLKGAAASKGRVITFLDAHCECTQGWLEPLLSEIHHNRKAVVCPIIDVISDNSFEYVLGSDMTWGGFNWKLNFRWYSVPQRENDRRNNDRTVPLRTPTMAGGLLAIDRTYFYEIGAYDPGMDIWGGENLEMSFRIWMCHGTLLIVTCSRVGHVFRKATPYTFPGGTAHIINHNNARLSNVWMDEWREFYYKINPGHVFRKVSPYSWPGGVMQILNHNALRTVEVWLDEYKDFYYNTNPAVRNTRYGDISDRLELRKKLQCKSFKWYLEHIYPESQMPLDYYSLGEVRNKVTGQCLDTMGRKEGENVGMVACHGMGGNQVWSYSRKKSFQSDELCLDVSTMQGPVKLFPCHNMGGNQLWTYFVEALSYTSDQKLQMDDQLCLMAVSKNFMKSESLVMIGSCAHNDVVWHYNIRTQQMKHEASSMCLDKPSTENPSLPSLSICTGTLSQKWELGNFNKEKYMHGRAS